MPTGPFEDTGVSSVTFGTTYNTTNSFRLPVDWVSRRDDIGLVLNLSTSQSSSTATELTFKLQVYDDSNEVWVDLYRDNGSGTFELEEYVIDDLSANTADQYRAIRLSLDGVPDVRLVGKADADTVKLTSASMSEVSRTHG